MALKTKALKIAQVIPCAAFMQGVNVVNFHAPAAPAGPTLVVIPLKGRPPCPRPLTAIQVKPAFHSCHTKGLCADAIPPTPPGLPPLQHHPA